MIFMYIISAVVFSVIIGYFMEGDLYFLNNIFRVLNANNNYIELC